LLPRRFFGEDAKPAGSTRMPRRRCQSVVRGEQLSKFTLQAYNRALKTFLRWLGRKG
jgi:hypothetical protein